MLYININRAVSKKISKYQTCYSVKSLFGHYTIQNYLDQLKIFWTYRSTGPQFNYTYLPNTYLPILINIICMVFYRSDNKFPISFFDFESLVCLFLFFHQTIGLANKFVKIHKNEIRNLLSDLWTAEYITTATVLANLDYKRLQQTKLNRYLEFRASLV